MTLNFDEALAEHGSAKEAITAALWLEWHQYNGDAKDSFDAVVAPWILDNAAAIHQHQSCTQANEFPQLFFDRINSVEQTSEDRYDGLEARLSALEDAPGPRANQEEVAALRQRMDSLTELVTKLTALDTSDVLGRLVRDVALLKDEKILGYSNTVTHEKHMMFSTTVFGTVPQTPEARKMLGLDVQPEPKPTDPNVYGPGDYEAAKQHIGKLCYFSDFEWVWEDEPVPLKNVFGNSEYPYLRKMMCFAYIKLADPQPLATPEPEPEPVYEWVGNDYYFDGKAVGSVSPIYNGQWLSCCEMDTRPYVFSTEAEARAWVEAQFNTPKQ